MKRLRPFLRRRLAGRPGSWDWRKPGYRDAGGGSFAGKRRRCGTWPYDTDFHWMSLHPMKIFHILHNLHTQAWSHAVKVLVKVLKEKQNLHSYLPQIQSRSVKVCPANKNLHRILRLIVKVVTVVKVFGEIRKKKSV
jgi:hypothetical protein